MKTAKKECGLLMYNASGATMSGAGIAYAATDYAGSSSMIGFAAIALGGLIVAFGAWRSKKRINSEM